MPDRKTPDQKLLARIERAIKKYSRNDTNASGYIFPNGAVYFVWPGHDTVADCIFQSLSIDGNGMTPIRYCMSLGIVRIANHGEFCVDAPRPPGSAVENAILDVAAGQKYDMVLVDFSPRYYRQAEFLRKKLEKGRF